MTGIKKEAIQPPPATRNTQHLPFTALAMTMITHVVK